MRFATGMSFAGRGQFSLMRAGWSGLEGPQSQCSQFRLHRFACGTLKSARGSTTDPLNKNLWVGIEEWIHFLRAAVGSNAQVALGSTASRRSKSVLSKVSPLLPISKDPSSYTYTCVYVCVCICVYVCMYMYICMCLEELTPPLTNSLCTASLVTRICQGGGLLQSRKH